MKQLNWLLRKNKNSGCPDKMPLEATCRLSGQVSTCTCKVLRLSGQVSKGSGCLGSCKFGLLI